MSVATEGAASVLSLPTGGGGLQSVGEKFSVDLQTGTGNLTVPIGLPPGRNGLQPKLTLLYTSANGNGPFGLGWALGVPGVARLTSKGVPRYEDAADTFVLSGLEELVPISSNAGVTRYRPRTESTFARIEHHRSAAGDYWEVRTGDGVVTFYGTPGAGAGDPAVVADPDDRSRIFSWAATRAVDPFGNLIEYRYERDAEREDGPHRWDQAYLSEVQYADYGDRQSPRFLASVRFLYEARPDPFSDGRAGFEIRTVRRCKRIEISTHADEPRLVRTYEFTYLDEVEERASRLPLNGASLLSEVVLVGHDGERNQALPPLRLTYSAFEPEGRAFIALSGPEPPVESLARPGYDLVDLDGNGLPDLLEMNGAVRFWRNLGDGQFDRPREMGEAPAGLRLTDPGVQLLDADGDGRLDLMVASEAAAGYFPLRFDGRWDRRSFRRYRQAPTFGLDDREVRLVDLDGDGVTDAIRSGARLECFFNDPEEGWVGTRFVERRALEEFPNVSFSDERVRLADMNGDGLPDVVLLHDGCVEYWPSLGYGDWGRRVTMRGSPRFPLGFDPGRVLLGDVDGDGAADLVYVDDRRVILWINRAGDGWSEPLEIHGTPAVADEDAVRLVDVLGTGVAGVLWSRDARSPGGGATAFFLDFTGGAKPYLLVGTDNGLGAMARVEYAPSTRFYLADRARPETRWKTPLPFPVQLVWRVESIDAISGGKLTSEYRYHHGYWDGAEREFRGFGRVDQIDTEVFDRYHGPGLEGGRRPFATVDGRVFAPPTETRVWFHLGPIGDEYGDWGEIDYGAEYWAGDPPALPRPTSTDALLRGLPRRARRDALRALRGSTLRTEIYARDGPDRQDRPFTVAESQYALREESPPGSDELERRRVFFPQRVAQRVTRWERGDDPMTQFKFTGEFDEYGQPRSLIAIAVPRGRDYRARGGGEPYLASHTATTYAHRDEPDRYLVSRVARTTTFEVVYDGTGTPHDLLGAILKGGVERRVVGQTLNYFDGPAFEGLPFGQLGERGVLVRTESLVLTEEMLREAYRADDTPVLPPYLAPHGEPPWTDEYPREFRDGMPPLGGYVYRPGGAEHEPGYFVEVERRCFDAQAGAAVPRGLLVASRDPFGHDTTFAYDEYAILPVAVTDPAGLTTRTSYDYRLLQPREVADPSGNRTATTYTPLGLPECTAIMGKPGEATGDTLDAPGTRQIYDLRAYFDRGAPASVRTARRVQHAAGAPQDLLGADETVESVQYLDGFGRPVQVRAQAEDLLFGDPVFGDLGLPPEPGLPAGAIAGRRRAEGAPPWVMVSGWQRYDNKGRVVEHFEPFFAQGWEYRPPSEAELGRSTRLYYHPLGQVERTVNPDGSEQRLVFGVPAALDDPGRFEPTPWECFVYDANDNAGRTHPLDRSVDPSHWNTPASVEIDALGRVVRSVARTGPDPATDWQVTRATYDLKSNLLAVVDPLGRLAFSASYDLAGRQLRMALLDAGVRRIVVDAAGGVVEQRDDRGALVLHEYDRAHRPIRLWARDAAGEPMTIRERLVYGDELPRDEAAAANLLGRLYQHFDEAGLVTFEAYDFKGNVVQKTRQVIADAALLGGVDLASGGALPAFRVDWQAPEEQAKSLLDPRQYRVSIQYDALSRPARIQYPLDVDGCRATLSPRYNRAGALEGVALDDRPLVDLLAYNARGQRTLAVFANGVMAGYGYHPDTFRLARALVQRAVAQDDATIRPAGQAFLDVGFGCDRVGNLVRLRDRAPGCGAPGTPLGVDALDREFAYDPLYRLISASGRECDEPPDRAPWDQRPRCVDPTRTRPFTHRYTYDAAGNLLELRHVAGAASFTRTFTGAADGNRLLAMAVGPARFEQEYDRAGNLIRETASRFFEWDHANRLRTFRVQAGEAEASAQARYLYDASGQRIKKLVRKQGGRIETTVYVEGIFEHHAVLQGGAVLENNTLHVMDDKQRIATVRVGTPFPDDLTPAIKLYLGGMGGTPDVVLDDRGNLVDREEYTPYGETSFGSFGRKRYRFAGKERDEESGLCYFGVRSFAPWLGRWISADPAGPVEGTNLYRFVRNNPLRRADPTGAQSVPGEGQCLEIVVYLTCTGDDCADLRRVPCEPGEEPFFKDEPPAEPEPTIEEPGFWEGLIPIWGSGKEAAHHFEKGNYGRALLYGALAASDVFMVKSLATAGGKLLFKGGASLLASEGTQVVEKAALAELTEASGKAGGEALAEVAEKGAAELPELAGRPAMAAAKGPTDLAVIAGGDLADEVVEESALAMVAKTKGDLVVLGPGSLSKIEDVTVVTHGVELAGKSGAVAVDLGAPYGMMSAEQFARFLVDAGWQGGTLRLTACGTGLASPLTGVPFGEALSQALARLGTPTAVIAPRGNVDIIEGVTGLPQVRDLASGALQALGKGWEYFVH